MNGIFASQTRRTFIRNTVCVTATAAIAPSCGIGEPLSVEEVTRYLVGLLRYPEPAGKLGKSYLKSDEAINSSSPQQLTEIILNEIGVSDLNAPGVSLDEIGTNITNKVRQDFSDETVVTVNGWLLSRTEARICALVHLYRGVNS